MKIAFAVGMASRHWTMNRVPQCVQAATPNRSTVPGGAPQFGQLISIGGSRPAGTIRCWIGGGGGGGARRNAFEPRRATKNSMMRKTIPATIGYASDQPDGPAFSRAMSPKDTRSKTVNTTDRRRCPLVREGFQGDGGGKVPCTAAEFAGLLDERSHGHPATRLAGSQFLD